MTRPTIRFAVRAVTVTALAGALVLTASAAGTAMAAPAGVTAASQQTQLRLKPLRVRDRLARMEAGRLLIPAGWSARGGVVWDFRYHTLASFVLQLRSKSGPEALETYKLIPHRWRKQGIFGFPEGSRYLGAIVHRPLSAVDYLERLALPRLRRTVRPRVIQRVRLAKVTKTLTAQARKLGFQAVSTRFDAARVRIAYRQGGRAIEEDFYAVISYSTSPILPGAVEWQPQFLYSFRAARGELDRGAALLQAIGASARVNLRWYAGYVQVFKLWVEGQMAAIRAAGEISRIIAEANDHISNLIVDSYWQRQDAYDRIHDSFSEYIRGVETYVNPYTGREVQLPSDYSYVWVSENGEYILSNDAGYDPNVGSTVNWRLLRTR